MRNRTIVATFARIRWALIGILLTLTASSSTASSDTAPPQTASPQDLETEMHQAQGTFRVKLAPEANETSADGAKHARMSIDKTFAGDLEGISKGEMLSVMTPTDGSAGYVAIERVTGTLTGKNGSFVLQHSGLMNRGDAQATIVVVPDSGTDELTGLTGSMEIIIENGEHRYVFDYSF